MKKLNLIINQSGDTIVEVLMAIAILATVIVSGYYLADNSLNTERSSQEHAEATAIAESQVESLRNQLSSGGGGAVPLSGVGCYDSTGQSTNTNCYVSPNNFTYLTTTCSSTYAWCYAVTICYSTGTPGCTVNNAFLTDQSGATFQVTTYEVKVAWPRLGGGSNTVFMFYRPT